MIDIRVPDWQTQGTCASIGAIFLDLSEVTQVKVCKDCAVQGECLDYGLAQEPASHTVTVTYGGLTPRKLVAEYRARCDDERYTTVECGRCGTQFHATQPNARYCSRHCQQAALRDRQIADSITRACRHVGQVA